MRKLLFIIFAVCDVILGLILIALLLGATLIFLSMVLGTISDLSHANEYVNEIGLLETLFLLGYTIIVIIVSAMALWEMRKHSFMIILPIYYEFKDGHNAEPGKLLSFVLKRRKTTFMTALVIVVLAVGIIWVIVWNSSEPPYQVSTAVGLTGLIKEGSAPVSTVYDDSLIPYLTDKERHTPEESIKLLGKSGLAQAAELQARILNDAKALKFRDRKPFFIPDDMDVKYEEVNISNAEIAGLKTLALDYINAFLVSSTSDGVGSIRHARGELEIGYHGRFAVYTLEVNPFYWSEWDTHSYIIELRKWGSLWLIEDGRIDNPTEWWGTTLIDLVR